MEKGQPGEKCPLFGKYPGVKPNGQYMESVHPDGNYPLFWIVFRVKNNKNSPPVALLTKILIINFGWEVSINQKFGIKKWTILGSVRTLSPRSTRPEPSS